MGIGINSSEYKIQGIIKINGINCFYLYDQQIREILSNVFKAQLEREGKCVCTIEVELNSPPSNYININGKENS
jgi:hypothetical protein